jgi:hypothetical protein
MKILEMSTRELNGMLDKDLILHLKMVIAGKIATPRGVCHGILTVLDSGHTRFPTFSIFHFPFSFFLFLLYDFIFICPYIPAHVFLAMAKVM